MIIRSGNLASVGTRVVSAVDTLHPNNTNPTTPLRPLVRTRSRDAVVAVSNAVADAGVSVTVTLFVSAVGGATQATAGSWRLLGQLNAGAPIVPSTGSSITHTNRIAFEEGVIGLLGWQYIWTVVTGTLAQNVTVEILGEQV